MVVCFHLLLLCRVSLFPDDPRVTSSLRTVLGTHQVIPVGHCRNLHLYVEAVNRRGPQSLPFRTPFSLVLWYKNRCAFLCEGKNAGINPSRCFCASRSLFCCISRHGF